MPANRRTRAGNKQHEHDSVKTELRIAELSVPGTAIKTAAVPVRGFPASCSLSLGSGWSVQLRRAGAPLYLGVDHRRVGGGFLGGQRLAQGSLCSCSGRLLEAAPARSAQASVRSTLGSGTAALLPAALPVPQHPRINFSLCRHWRRRGGAPGSGRAVQERRGAVDAPTVHGAGGKADCALRAGCGEAHGAHRTVVG
ncbi:hypothetical protein NDU88_001122 [Pleurodeles waltl]|uniref:Uncharacterized protein n=1 Tax=Pleurodeles waltl TaxID=8319 RepID=A0AAV7V981_PLEWA|nr:hypothetical protein NDU88_001122 [Pleurodeles waltl]